MIKKINIFLVLLLLLISVGAVSAADEGNITDMVSSEAIQDTIEVSVDEDIDYSSDDILTVEESSSELSASPIKVTEKNYNEYFSSVDGSLVSTKVNSGDTIELDGSFSGKSFVFNKQVNIVGTSTNNMKNSMITLLKGASGSTVSNLKIVNTKSETYGIFLNSASNCIINGCKITTTNAKSAYPICVANNANYNNVTNNYLKTSGESYGHGTRSTPPFIISGSHHNYVANNRIEVADANGIYLSSYAGGPLKGGNSNFNIIYNNTIQYKDVLPTSWAYGIQVMGSYNVIKANKVIGAYRGISTAGSYNNITGNIIINVTGADYNHLGVETGGEYGIVAANNSYVSKNTIIGAKIIATGAGISGISGSIIENNIVNVTKNGRGIVAAGSDVTIKNNVINTELGSGIYEKDEGSGLLVDGNTVNSGSAVGILVEKLSSKRMPSNVTIINNIITSTNKFAIDVSGVSKGTAEIENNEFKKSTGVNSPAGIYDASKPTYTYKGKTIKVTQSNIRKYINANGGLTSEVNDSDILFFEGTFSNEIIQVNKRIKITGENPIFYNSTFKVTEGNVLIENLNIINKDADRVNAWGIFTNQASGVRIMNNKISVSDPKAAYAIYILESTNVDVFNNDLTSEGDYLTFTLLSYASEDCNFVNNTIHTVGTGKVYSFTPESCLDGNELVIDGKYICIDGNEIVIDGQSYCIDGEEIVIDGNSYCIDGENLVINGQSFCIDGNELVIDGKTVCVDGNEIVIGGTSYCIDGENLVINGQSFCIDGNELVIDGKAVCIDGEEIVIDGKSYCLDGNEIKIDGKSYCIDGGEICIDGKTVCIDGGEIVIDGKSYCLDGGEICIDGKTYCLDGGELVIDGESYCIDGNELVINGTSYGTEYSKGNAHVVSEIYQTYGILLLYSSNNVISGNDVNVTSKLDQTYSVIADKSTNSLVGIDLYFNSHNNIFSDNTVFIKAFDNHLYGMGVLGYNTGHSAPEGQGATNNVFEGNEITLEGPYFTTGLIVGHESEGTVLKDNVINLNSNSVSYGITLETSQKSIITGNKISLTSDEVIYGMEVYSSNNNDIDNNSIKANAKQVYGIIVANGCDNNITNNLINANGNGNAITVKNLDALGYGNAGLYLMYNSSDNQVLSNNFTSTKGYSILVDNDAINNIISDNYLVCEKGIGNKAVSYPKGNTVSQNYKYIATATADKITVPYLGTVKLSITFDSKLNGATVEFYDSALLFDDTTYIGKATVSNGVASLDYKLNKNYAPGKQIFSAKLLKEDYKSSNHDINVVIDKGNIVISVKDASIMQDKSGNIVATVLDEFGNPIKGATVSFNRLNSANRPNPIGTATSDENGMATISYLVPLSVTEGDYAVTAEVSGVKNYNDASTTSKLTVLKKVSITGAKSYSVYYGNTVTYKVYILDNDKKPVANQVVTFKINGKTKNVKTNSKGYASYSVKLKTGTYTITATCNGIKVSKEITFKPTVIAKNLNKKKAKKIKYTAKLVNNKGKILKNKKITFKVKGKKYTAKTNKKGIATITLKNLKVGKYAITATYGGCTVKKTINIKK